MHLTRTSRCDPGHIFKEQTNGPAGCPTGPSGSRDRSGEADHAREELADASVALHAISTPRHSVTQAERDRQADDRQGEQQPEPRLPPRDQATQPVGAAVGAAKRHGAPPASGLPWRWWTERRTCRL